MVGSPTVNVNVVAGDHSSSSYDASPFIIDGKTRMDVFDKTPRKVSFRYSANMDLEIGSEKQIPLWLFGFLY